MHAKYNLKHSIYGNDFESNSDILDGESWAFWRWEKFSQKLFFEFSKLNFRKIYFSQINKIVTD